jgi:hypothetical protein
MGRIGDISGNGTTGPVTPPANPYEKLAEDISQLAFPAAHMHDHDKNITLASVDNEITALINNKTTSASDAKILTDLQQQLKQNEQNQQDKNDSKIQPDDPNVIQVLTNIENDVEALLKEHS